jgi:type I restriction enzyme R subunit
MDIAEDLSGKYNITDVLRSKPLIESLKDPEFYKALSQKKLEEIREEIRELVQYLDSSSKPVFYTNLLDTDFTITETEPNMSVNYGTLYRKRVESFIRENKHNLIISKLSSNMPITAQELTVLEEVLFDGTDRGTREDFIKEFGEAPLGVFIRSIIGLDVKAAQEAFAGFLTAGNLKADQITFIQNIISYLAKNGTIDPGMLFEPPFTDINDQGLMGVFDDGASTKIISIIEKINENALGA